MKLKSFQPDEKKIEKATGNWFRHASDRVKARAAKSSKTAAAN